MKSLAEHLGVIDPRQPDDAPRPKPTKKQIREFCAEILASDEYRASLLRRIFLDELPPAIEALIYHYAHGKPVEKMEVHQTTASLEELSAEQLEQRAMFLVECARRMRINEDSTDEDALPPPIH